MVVEFLYISFLAFLFWFFLKLADAHNEHGMKSFLWAGLLYGILWWAVWAYLITYSQNLFTFYLATLFYWMYKLKLDYVNHALAGIIMFAAALYHGYDFRIFEVLILLLSVASIDYLKVLNKNKLKNNFLNSFFKYKPQFLIGPIIFAIVLKDILILTYFASIGAKYVTIKLFKINN